MARMDPFVIVSLAVSMAMWISPSSLNILDIVLVFFAAFVVTRLLKLFACLVFGCNLDNFLTPFALPPWPPRLFVRLPPTIPQRPLLAPLPTSATPAPLPSPQNNSSKDSDDSENDEDTLSNGVGDVSLLGISAHHNGPDNSAPSTASGSSDDEIESPVPGTAPCTLQSPQVTRLSMSLLELTHGDENFELSQTMPQEFITDVNSESVDSGVEEDLREWEIDVGGGSILSRQRPVGRRPSV